MVGKSKWLQDEIVYTTYPEFEYEYANINEAETLAPGEQMLSIALTKRKIDGALVTVVSGFVGHRVDLLKIADELIQVCRTSGSTGMCDIRLMRDVRKRVYVYLRNQGYGVQFSVS